MEAQCGALYGFKIAPGAVRVPVRVLVCMCVPPLACLCVFPMLFDVLSKDRL